jgi:ADP-ribose pyrophosphatase YjhB (NUDIX family)
LDSAGRLGRREPNRSAKCRQGSARGERLEVEPLKLAAVWDRTKQGHAPHVFSCCKLFFVCALIGGRAATSHETSEIGWFYETNIPADLSLERVLPQQIRRMFAHRRDPALSTDFD